MTFSPSTPDHFAWWRNALAGTFGPMHENVPQPGYYRTRPRRGERAEPVAIWHDGTGLRALRSGRPADPFALWTWCCRTPVSYETYVAVSEKGEDWPEAVPMAAGVKPSARRRGAARPQGRGAASKDAPEALRIILGFPAGAARFGAGRSHRPDQPPPPAAAPTAHPRPLPEGLEPALGPGDLLRQIEVYRQDATAWLAAAGVPTTQEGADKAANYAGLFALIEKAAEEARTAEKRPSLEQGRAVDRRWKPVLAAAEEAKRQMKKAVEPFLLARLEALQEASSCGLVEDKDMPRAGTLDRRIGLRRQRAVAVIDETILREAYASDPRLWSQESVRKALLDLAEADLAAGRTVPGALLVDSHVAV